MKKLVRLGHKALRTLAFPGVVAAEKLVDPDWDGRFARKITALTLSAAFWPITLPLAVVIGPISCAYDEHFRIDEDTDH